MIVFLVRCPTPQRNPVLDRLHAELVGEPVHTFYDFAAIHDRGWGELSIKHPATVLSGASAWLAFARALASPELSVVCMFGYRGIARISAALTARLRGVPLVLRGDTNVRPDLARSKAWRAFKSACLRALLGRPEVWAIGSANAAYWSLMGFHRQQRIPYAVPVLPGGAELGPALRTEQRLDGRFVFGYVGRLEVGKGIVDLLDAYDRVRAATPPGATGLLIAGPGSAEPEVRDYAAAHDDVRYLGPVPYGRLGAVYRAMDALVVPSHREAWGLVVNEALGYGTRVIASAEVGAADDLCTVDTGRRYEPCAPEPLAAAMLAEYERGPGRVPVLECPDTAWSMAERLATLSARRARQGRPMMSRAADGGPVERW